jgi:hypothetical protein
MKEKEIFVLSELSQNFEKHGYKNIFKPKTKEFDKSYQYNIIRALTKELEKLNLGDNEYKIFCNIMVENIVNNKHTMMHLLNPQKLIEDVYKSIEKNDKSHESIKKDLARSHKNLKVENLEKLYKAGFVSEYYISMSKECMNEISKNEFIEIDRLFLLRKMIWKIMQKDELNEIFGKDLIKIK